MTLRKLLSRLTQSGLTVWVSLAVPLLPVLSLVALCLSLLTVLLASILGGLIITYARLEMMLKTRLPAFSKMRVFRGNRMLVMPLRWSLAFLTERQKRVLFAVTLTP